MDELFGLESICNEYECEYGNKTVTVECRIDTSSKGGVTKLLSVSGVALRATCEMSEKGIKIASQVDYKIIYLDRENMLQSVDYLSDFDCVLPKVEGFRLDSCRACACVMDIDNSLSQDTIKLQAVVNVKAYGIKISECECVTDVAQGILVKDETITSQKYIGDIKELFAVTEDYESGADVEKILFFDSSAIVKKAVVVDSKVQVSGEVVAQVTYLASGIITNKTFNIPYTEEVLVPNSVDDLSDLHVSVCASVVDSKIILTGSSVNNIMCLQFDICLLGVYCEIETKKIILDMCSPTQELKLTYCKMSSCTCDKSLSLSDKVCGSAMLKDSMNSAKKIMSTNIARNCIVNTNYKDGKINVEGVLACNVIYENNNSELCPMMIEVPYCMEFDNTECDKMCKFNTASSVEVMNTKIKGDREVEVSVMMTLNIGVSRCRECSCVCKVEIGAEKINENFAISIYSAEEGEDLWEIAKNMNVPMEEIVKQNPKVVEGLGGKVIYYRQLM